MTGIEKVYDDDDECILVTNYDANVDSNLNLYEQVHDYGNECKLVTDDDDSLDSNLNL